MLPAGLLREVVVIEKAEEHRNDVGETVQTSWHEVVRRRANIEQLSGSEQVQMGQTAGSSGFTVRMRYCSALKGGMRLRWENRQNRILYISSIVEKNNREEHEVFAEERP